MQIDQLIGYFLEWSGRLDMEDLVVVDYLNAGQKFLDDLTSFQHSPGRYLYPIAKGESFASFVAEAKVINSVELLKDTESFPVTIIPIGDLKVLSDTLPSSRPQAKPTLCSLADFRKVSGAVPAGYVGKLGLVETGSGADKLGLLFECPVDIDYLIDITGKFYSEACTVQQAGSWWAAQYGMTLVHAALYQLEISYRNSEGAKDWLTAIKVTLAEINNNVIEQECLTISRMEG